MRRLLLPLVLVVVVAAACKGGGIRPTPVAPTLVHPPSWVGTVVQSIRSVQAGIKETDAVEGPVTWIEDDNPELTPLVMGTASYKIQSGSLTVTHTAVPESGPCTGKGETTLTLKSGDGSLVLGPDGTYTGHIRAEAPYSVTMSCPGVGSVSVPTLAFINLRMEGQVDNLGIMEGRMVPLVHAVTGVTITGSWTFVAR